jgi:hypothetical protein
MLCVSIVNEYFTSPSGERSPNAHEAGEGDSVGEIKTPSPARNFVTHDLSPEGEVT